MKYRFIFTKRSENPIKAAFLDRDGVINIDHAYVGNRSNFEFIPGAIEGIRLLRDKGFVPVIVTNQSGIGRAKYSLHEFSELTFWMAGVLEASGAAIGALYFCPHHPTGAFAPYLKACTCRKPEPGMTSRLEPEPVSPDAFLSKKTARTPSPTAVLNTRPQIICFPPLNYYESTSSATRIRTEDRNHGSARKSSRTASAPHRYDKRCV